MAAFGLTAEDFAGETVDIWPENLAAFNLFCSIRTQFIIGPGGATGLNYLVLYHKLDRMGLTPEAYDQLEADVQVMECAALNKMHEKK